LQGGVSQAAVVKNKAVRVFLFDRDFIVSKGLFILAEHLVGLAGEHVKLCYFFVVVGLLLVLYPNCSAKIIQGSFIVLHLHVASTSAEEAVGVISYRI